MLYKANNDTKRICLRIRRNGRDVCCTEMQLRLTELVCDEVEHIYYEYSPCGGIAIREKKRESTFTLVYDMFDYDELGNVCFLLDRQFTDLCSGRYNAEIVACGRSVYKFQIDKREDLRVTQVIMDNQSNCCEGKYGC